MKELIIAFGDLLFIIGKLILALIALIVLLSPLLLIVYLRTKHNRKQAERKEQEIKRLLDYHAKQVAIETSKIQEYYDAKNVIDSISAEELIQIIDDL